MRFTHKYIVTEVKSLILFIRHLESVKNILGCFSSEDDLESLTEQGKEKGKRIASVICDFVRKNSMEVHNIYCANSERAKITAKIIGQELKVDIKCFDELRSNNSGILKGKTEEESNRINPIFMHQLKLFRAGIFSSYNFVKIDEREDKHDFEQRVDKCIKKIMEDKDESLKIIVLHHSSITAAIINIARKLYGYPSDYYGYVACEFGNIYLVSSEEIILCNDPAERLLTVEI